MSRFNTLLAVILLAGGTIFSQSAFAQYSYTPQSPAISPWMGLWNNNTGAVDNYHTFVQPQLELNKTLQMQSAALNRQARGLRDLNSEINQPQGAQSGMMPTGQGSTFMNYSHYYGNDLRQPSHTVRPGVTGPRPLAGLPSPSSSFQSPTAMLPTATGMSLPSSGSAR
jgi:hypothetical protein